LEVDYVAVLLGELLEPEPWFFDACFYGFWARGKSVAVRVEFVFLLKLEMSIACNTEARGEHTLGKLRTRYARPTATAA